MKHPVKTKSEYIEEVATIMNKTYGYTHHEARNIVDGYIPDNVSRLCEPKKFVDAFIAYKQGTFKVNLEFANRIAK